MGEDQGSGSSQQNGEKMAQIIQKEGHVCATDWKPVWKAALGHIHPTPGRECPFEFRKEDALGQNRVQAWAWEHEGDLLVSRASEVHVATCSIVRG